MRIIRNRVFFLVSIIVAATVTVMFAATSYFLMRSFDREEAAHAVEEGLEAVELLRNEIDQMNLKLADWAQWDDTYQFIQDGNPEYLESNVNNEALKILGVDAMVFMNRDGRTVASLSIDPETGTEMSLPRGLEDHLRKGDFLATHEDVKSAKKGLLVLDDETVMVASQPIVRSNGQGPALGTVVFVSALDRFWQKEFSSLIRRPFAFSAHRDQRMPSDFSAVKSALSKEGDVVTREVSESRLAVFGLLSDVYGEPGLIYRIEADRTMHAQGIRALRMFAFVLSGLGFVFFLSLSSLLRREVLSRVEKLSDEVSAFAAGGVPAAKISIPGDDEISVLAQKIDEMVRTIHTTKIRERESESRFRLIADTAPIMIWMSDKTGAFTYFNKGWLDFTGRTPDEVLGEGFAQDFHPGDREKAIRVYREAFDARRPFRNEFRLRRNDGEYRHMLANGVPYYGSVGEFLGYVGVSFDIEDRHLTERKREERIEEVEKLNAVMVSRELRMIELKEELKRLRGLLEARGGGVVRKSTSGRAGENA